MRPGAAQYTTVCTQALRDDVYMLTRPMPQPRCPDFILSDILARFGCHGGLIAAGEPVPPVALAPMPRESDELAALQRQLAELKRLMAQATPPAPREFVGVGPGGLELVPLVPPGGFRTPPGCCYPPPARIQVVVADDLMCPPCPLPQITVNPLVGTWYRDTGVGVVAATFTHDELKLCLTQREGANTVTFTVTAHYTLTKDGLVFGAVTGADVDAKSDGKGGGGVGIELAEMSLVMQELADRPFSFRTKATSAGLMVSQLKAASGEQFRGQELAVLGGLYKSAKDGKVPAPSPLKTVGGVGKCDSGYNPADYTVAGPTAPYPTTPAPSATERGGVVGAQLGGSVGAAVGALTGAGSPPAMSEPVQRIGIDFNFNPPQVFPPAGLCPPKAPTALPGCNDAMKAMAADAFGQLLRPAGGTTLPGVQYNNASDAAFPERYDPAARTAVLAPFAQQVHNGTSVPKPAHVGSWVREVGSKQCVLKLAPDYLTLTLSEAREADGKVVTSRLSITADYHLARDGQTVVGLITGVDYKAEGDLPDPDSRMLAELLGHLQRELDGKPFAMSVRPYDDALVIGSVRAPQLVNVQEFQPSVYLGGRFASVGDKPLPKPRTVKVTDPFQPGNGPSPYGPQPYPGASGRYTPPPSPAPDYIPVPYIPTSPGEALPPPARVVYPPVVPTGGVLPPIPVVEVPGAVPPMPQPIPPAVQIPYSISLGSGMRVVVPPLSQTPRIDLDTTRQLFNFYIGFFNQ